MREVWAKAEDGSVVCVHFPPIWSRIEDALDAGWWPPVGLTLIGDESAVNPTAFVDVTHLGLIDRDQSSLSELESDIGLFTAAHMTSRVALHAALISDGENSIAFPGRSKTGKSSLCLAALDAGLIVHSDEYTLVHPVTGLVSGWHRRLRIREGRGSRRIPIPQRPNEDLMLTHVAHLQFNESIQSGSSLDVRVISQSQTAMCLVDNAVAAQLRPELVLEAALKIARLAVGIQGRRGDASQALHELFGR